MNANPVCHPIDIDNWPRKAYFDYYFKQVKCTYSVTVNIDIGELLKECKSRSIKLYPAMIYLITRAVNQIDALRVGRNERGDLGLWNFMSPSFTVFHQDDKTFSNIWTDYDDSFAKFHLNYLDDIKRYGEVKDFMAKGDEPANTFTVSCVPWIDFTGFNLNIYNGEEYLSPIFTLGKYFQQDKKIVIPLAVQLHHAVCDGYHAGLFFEKIKETASAPDAWLAV